MTGILVPTKLPVQVTWSTKNYNKGVNLRGVHQLGKASQSYFLAQEYPCQRECNKCFLALTDLIPLALAVYD